MKTDLSAYNNHPYHPRGSAVKRLLWFYVNALLFKTSLLPVNTTKRALLKLFGAKVGKRVVIKPGVSIKYPWLLTIGDYVWIGENVWIDNLVQVSISNNVCLSQGAMLLTGNHNYKKCTFNLITGGIVLEEGVWICARAMVCPGVTVHSHAVLNASSVATSNLQAYAIYQGNPAVKIRDRHME